MPKINREEYEILKALDGYTHLARDKNRFRDKSLLQAYQIKPNRKEYLWVNPNNTDVEDLDENLFQFIQWEDEEPYSIAELIEEYEDSKEYKDSLVIEYFMDKAKESEETEVKNKEELKHRHGYDVASSSGLIGMEMQGAMTIFAVNLKRIVKLINEK